MIFTIRTTNNQRRASRLAAWEILTICYHLGLWVHDSVKGHHLLWLHTLARVYFRYLHVVGYTRMSGRAENPQMQNHYDQFQARKIAKQVELSNTPPVCKTGTNTSQPWKTIIASSMFTNFLSHLVPQHIFPKTYIFYFYNLEPPILSQLTKTCWCHNQPRTTSSVIRNKQHTPIIRSFTTYSKKKSYLLRSNITRWRI